MWVEFIAAFRWKPAPGVVIRYLPGMRLLVTRRCAEKAIAKGAAKKSKNPGASNGKRRNNHRLGEAAAEAEEASPSGSGRDPGRDGEGGGSDRRHDEEFSAGLERARLAPPGW